MNNTTTITNVIFNSSTIERIKVNEYSDRIEFIYKGHSNISNNFGSLPPKVFKIVFSCIDGKWNKSDRIYGEIIPATEESYEFDI